VDPSDKAGTEIIPKIPSVSLETVKIVVVEGSDRGKTIELEPGATHVGTSASCALRLSDASVSRVHCEIRVEPGAVRIIDPGSTNGTAVNGVEVRDALLASGSTVRIGGTTLRIEFGPEPITLLLPEQDRFGELLGSSMAMRRVYAFLERVAPTDSTVLVRGETGTGKEMVARSIHAASKRAKGPFVAVDCGAIAENLIESELFGHVRGSFSGAAGDRRGLFEEANHGTLFLDEIGELPQNSQPKLLRALETREVRRVGSNASKAVDVRVIAATNRPLGQSVNQGAFREDLYYRLAVFEIALPPLRERREDIPQLARRFLENISGGAANIPDGAVLELARRDWPGNVRELKNFVERSACLGWSSEWQPNEPVPTTTLPSPAIEGLVRTDLPLQEARSLWSTQLENIYLAALLRRTGGNVTRAAELAGISRRSFHRLLADHRIRGAKDEE
jgi:transcriptional regulator with PAS, ATPase and Fis domain